MFSNLAAQHNYQKGIKKKKKQLTKFYPHPELLIK